jgi:Holliday junction DNA helicase RuvA
VDRGDLSAITRIPGVGRKTAERLLVELRDRIGKIDTGHDAAGGPSVTAMYREEAVAALEALGIGKTAAEKLIRTASEGDTAPVDTAALVRRALREL